MSYKLEGTMVEVCTCNVLCPCFIGQDPDGGTCEGVLVFKIEQGMIEDADVSGRTLAMVVHLPGNVFQGNWKLALFVDNQATPAQHDALVRVWTGKLGGPVADLAQLYGEVVAVESASISFGVTEGSGALKMGDEKNPLVMAEFANFSGPRGEATTLLETPFSSVPGAPFYVAKASTYRRHTASYGLKNVELSGHNALHGAFRFET